MSAGPFPSVHGTILQSRAKQELDCVLDDSEEFSGTITKKHSRSEDRM